MQVMAEPMTHSPLAPPQMLAHPLPRSPRTNTALPPLPVTESSPMPPSHTSPRHAHEAIVPPQSIEIGATENSPQHLSHQVYRKPVPSHPTDVAVGAISNTSSSLVRVQLTDNPHNHEPQSAVIEEHGSQLSLPNSRSVSGNLSARDLTPPPDPRRLSIETQGISDSRSSRLSDLDGPTALRQRNTPTHHAHPSAELDPRFTPRSSNGRMSQYSVDDLQQEVESYQPLQYHHQAFRSSSSSVDQIGSRDPSSREHVHTPSGSRLSPGPNSAALMRHSYGENLSPRPLSAISMSSDFRGRRTSHNTPDSNARARSAHSSNSDFRHSYVDLLNVPYPQPPPVPLENLDNTQLRNAVGNNASLLSTRQTIEMYRANVKKTHDPAVQYEFGVFMVSCAQEANLEDEHSESAVSEKSHGTSHGDLLKEARHILQRLSDKSYPFAQYYLADGYSSGLFNKGKEDYDRAFPLFISASKHGHAEAGYRAALCYEFGWGTRVEAAKAVQFYRQSASKNHPGAMMRLGKACLVGDLGLGRRYREGVKWLKRAAETADFQYNAAPYELGVLHETGYGDDIFQDESYTAQLFTKSADLGHAEANYRLGDAYEHGKLTCPVDPALSVHFYTGAAERGHPLAMMALCAWYMVGAEPILDKDENEAYEWARRAAEAGLPKAEYAVGYFTEMGIGCRRDPLEANVWYVRAAEHGDDRAKHRLNAIRAAATGANPETAAGGKVQGRHHQEAEKKKKFGIF